MSEGPETHEAIKPIEETNIAPKPTAASKEMPTEPVDAETFTETARPRGFGRGKNGLRSTAAATTAATAATAATDEAKEERYRMKETQETKETKERNVDTKDKEDKERKKAPKGADSISRSDEKKSYYQPLPAKGSGGRGSGPDGHEMK